MRYDTCDSLLGLKGLQLILEGKTNKITDIGSKISNIKSELQILIFLI